MKTFLLIAATFIGLPVLSYMVMKFGTAGFLRAKRREKEREITKSRLSAV